MATRINPKVAAGGVAGAVVTIGVWAVGLAGVTVPAEVASAATVIVAFAAGYLVPAERGGKHVADE
ncbi:hypothetical protein ABIQ69_15415 [Agromyces sp. G08B096]|uniref:Holin n=1 Tax=Agromyces sp. G08B096 TaxID=3156399 RepID=A0AAU7W8C9_9MICO